MSTKDPIFQEFWPYPRSIDLVEAPFDLAYEAISNQVANFVGDEPLEKGWEEHGSIEELFSSVPYLSSVPTIYWVLPTKSNWTAIWNNCFEFNGHDQLCWNLSALHKLTTICWGSSDTADVFQAGSHFTHRSHDDERVVIRSVHCSIESGNWHSFTQGEPLPEEDAALIDPVDGTVRMDETAMMQLLDKLGARPWRDSFYDLSEGRVYRVERTRPPASAFQRSPEDIRYKG